MRQTTVTTFTNVVRRITPIACAAILALTTAACGSTNKPSTTTPTPTPTTSPAGPATTTPAPTSAPKSGGAGF